MTGHGLEIDTALSGDGPIASEQVLSWIDAAADSDLLTLSKLYRLTGEGYYRIQPELGRGPTCALIQRYLLGCIQDGVADNDEIQERYTPDALPEKGLIRRQALTPYSSLEAAEIVLPCSRDAHHPI